MALAGLLLLCAQLHRTSGGVLAGYFADTRGYSPSAIGAIVGMLYLASAVIQLPFGVLFDRYGTRLTTTAMGVLAVVGIAGFALARSPESVMLSRFAIGAGHGGVIAGIYMLAVAWAPPDRLASTTATVIAISAGTGAVLSTGPLDAAIRGFGFEATYLALAAATALVTLAIFALVRDRPAGAPEPGSGVETLAQTLRGLWQVATDRELRPIFVMSTCFSAPFLAVGGLWAGPYLRDVHRLEPAQVGWVLMAMMVAFYLGTFTYGPLDRLFNTRKRVVLAGAALQVLLLAVLVAFPEASAPAVVAVLLAFSLCCPFFATLAAHCRSFVPFERTGRAIACLNLGGLLTTFLMQAGTGVIIEATAAPGGGATPLGYRLTFAAVAVALLLAGGVYLGARDVPPR